jgi:photosystem II stability/assembly factor-like uncharacterized protein
MRKSGVMLLWMTSAIAASCGGPHEVQLLDSAPAPASYVQWLSPLPAGVQLNAVRMFESRVGIAVGELGTVLVTNDGGLTWSVAVSGTQRALKGIAFARATHAVAVGEGGTVLRTDDGGQTWAAISSNTSGELRAAAFGTPDVGIIVGAGGVVLRTGDGGRQWQAVASGVTATLRGAVFATPSVAVAAGDDGTLIRSTDGGLHWGRSSSGTSAALRGVQFIDAMTGVAVGGDDLLLRAARVVLRTTDGGATWSKAVTPGGGRLYGVTRAGPGQLIAVGEEGATLRTSDASLTWQAITADKSAWLASVSSAGSNVVAVGEAGKIFHSADLGTKWTFLQEKQPAIEVSSVARAGKDTILIAGGPSILRSANGRDFVKATTTTDKAVNAICLIDSLVGVAVGAEGTIQHTIDGGQTWTAVESRTTRDLWAVAFSDAKDGIAVGRYGFGGPSMVRTEDAGRTWRAQPCRSGMVICDGTLLVTAMAFDRSGFGMAVGGAGAVIKTTDGGRSWTQLPQNLTSIGLRSVAVLDDKTAVAVGRLGVILHTGDRGATWTRRDSGKPLGLNSVAFADRLHGLAVGQYGTVLATTDGGLTWRTEPQRTRGDLESVILDSSGVAFIAGRSGLVWRHTWDNASQGPAANPARGAEHE